MGPHTGDCPVGIMSINLGMVQGFSEAPASDHAQHVHLTTESAGLGASSGLSLECSQEWHSVLLL